MSFVICVRAAIGVFSLKYPALNPSIVPSKSFLKGAVISIIASLGVAGYMTLKASESTAMTANARSCNSAATVNDIAIKAIKGSG
ncbi:hypothetical protein ACMAZF_16065 [Psychrobium sp. nBUS_13]|uniref:hypothetical protein n=1 Tax=Psychrobium sp. nBUS_13 TaxID=3395319 RepID=UPI003EB6EAD3